MERRRKQKTRPVTHSIQNAASIQGQVIGQHNTITMNYRSEIKEASARFTPFHLTIRLSADSLPDAYGKRKLKADLLIVSIGNTGTDPSYVSHFGLEVLIDGEARTAIFEVSCRSFPTNHRLKDEGPVLQGQRRTYYVHAAQLSADLQRWGEKITFKEAFVEDEVGNRYTTSVSDELTTWLLSFPPPRKYPYSLL